MQDWQQQFIDLAIKYEVLCFGEFVLKSGRTSPYFFNAGLFDDGAALSVLGRTYADAIMHNKLEYDVIFGPAYKGIPLAAAISVALAEHHDTNVAYCFNRKEKKEHGEGGNLVGADIKGKRVLIVDDVITAGTAIREALTIIEEAGGTPAGVVIGLDRQEKGENNLSAVQEVSNSLKIPVVSVVTLDKIVEYVESQGGRLQEHLPAIKDYQEQYGI